MTSARAPIATFAESLLVLAERYPDLVVVSTGQDHAADLFAGSYPDRFHRTGTVVELAVKLSAQGLRPIVSGFPLEQARSLRGVRAPIVLAGFDSDFDIWVLRTIPEVAVVIPADTAELVQALAAALLRNGPTFIEVRDVSGPSLFEKTTPLEIGHIRKLREGSELTIAVCGAATGKAMRAVNHLAEEGISIDLLEISTVQPLDTETLLSSARKTHAVLTVDEHPGSGGLGSVVAETLCRYTPTGMQMISADGEPVSQERIEASARLMTWAAM